MFWGSKYVQQYYAHPYNCSDFSTIGQWVFSPESPHPRRVGHSGLRSKTPPGNDFQKNTAYKFWLHTPWKILLICICSIQFPCIVLYFYCYWINRLVLESIFRAKQNIWVYGVFICLNEVHTVSIHTVSKNGPTAKSIISSYETFIRTLCKRRTDEIYIKTLLS